MKLAKKDDAYIRIWAKKLRALQILGNVCTRCGIADFRVLDLHHKGHNKLYSLNRLRSGRWSLIEKELTVCELVCSNCHREEHCSTTSYNYQHKLSFLKSIGMLDVKCSHCS
jgi:hypothetical protein